MKFTVIPEKFQLVSEDGEVVIQRLGKGRGMPWLYVMTWKGAKIAIRIDDIIEKQDDEARETTISWRIASIGSVDFGSYDLTVPGSIKFPPYPFRDKEEYEEIESVVRDAFRSFNGVFKVEPLYKRKVIGMS